MRIAFISAVRWIEYSKRKIGFSRGGRVAKIRKLSLNTLVVAVLSVGMALALRIVGRPIIGDDAPFLFFFGAMALAAWYGGLFPGLLATILGAISVAVYYLPPVNSEGVIETTHILHWCVFIAIGVLVSFLMEKLHDAIEQSLRTERELERRVQERTAELADANRALTIEKNKLLGILDQMPEAVYIVNPEDEIEYVNPAMEREFGKPEKQKCYHYTQGAEAGRCSSCRNLEVFSGKSFSGEWISPMNNKVYDCFEAPIATRNGRMGKLKIMHDITAVKRAEEELLSRHLEVQRLSGELLNIQESERLRVSKELHDELGQALTLIKLKISLVEANLTRIQGPIKKFCEEACDHVDAAIENMRRLSRDLSPITVETLGITTALRRLSEEFDRAGEIRIAAKIDPIDDLLPLRSAIVLFRIVQEGLNNIVKHSGASEAGLSIRSSGDRIYYELRDNGKGLDLKQKRLAGKAAGGLGLAIMNERVRTLGGSMEIDSREGSGTTLTFTLPVEKETIAHGCLPVSAGR